MVLYAGIDDISTLSVDYNLTLGELGLDSLMGLDIRQALEREAGIIVNVLEIRELTFAKLQLMTGGPVQVTTLGSNTTTTTLPLNAWINEHYDMKHLMPLQALVKLNSSTYHPKQLKPLFIVAPIEGTAKILKTLASKLDCGVYGLQCSDAVPLTSIKDMAAFYVEVSLDCSKLECRGQHEY